MWDLNIILVQFASQPRSQGLSSSHKREWSKKDPGSGWSRASQKVGGDKKTMRGRYNQVIILSFLNPLLMGKIYVKYNTSYMCHSIGCEILCKVKCYRLRKRFIQRLVTQRVVVGFAKLWGILITVGICLAKQIVRCSLPRKIFTAVPSRGVNHCRIFSVDLVKDGLEIL